MKRLLPFSTLGAAVLVGAGLLTLPGTTTAADLTDDAVAKREDNVTELALVDDDGDGDDTNDTDTNDTGFSRPTGDGTRSNFTGVSRDRDLSRSDKTRDFTFDGPGDTRTRDTTGNRTNDRSRNDSRG